MIRHHLKWSAINNEFIMALITIRFLKIFREKTRQVQVVHPDKAILMVTPTKEDDIITYGLQEVPDEAYLVIEAHILLKDTSTYTFIRSLQEISHHIHTFRAIQVLDRSNRVLNVVIVAVPGTYVQVPEGYDMEASFMVEYILLYQITLPPITLFYEEYAGL